MDTHVDAQVCSSVDKPPLQKSKSEHQYPVPENLLYAARLKQTQCCLATAHSNEKQYKKF